MITPGQELFSKIYPFLLYAVVIVCLVVIIKSLIEKKITKVIGAILACSIALYFVFAPVQLLYIGDLIVSAVYKTGKDVIESENQTNIDDLFGDFKPTELK